MLVIKTVAGCDHLLLKLWRKLLTLHSSKFSGVSWSAPLHPQTIARKWTVDPGGPPVRAKIIVRFDFVCQFVYCCARGHVCTLLNWAQETIMLLKSSAKSGLSNIFWAKKCWLYWSRLCCVWTSEVNLLLRVLHISLQGTRSGTTNGTLSWWQQQRGWCSKNTAMHLKYQRKTEWMKLNLRRERLYKIHYNHKHFLDTLFCSGG